MTAIGLQDRYERVAAGTFRFDTHLALSRTFVSADDARRSSCRQLRRFSPVKANFEITRRHGRSFRSVHRLDNIRYPKTITVYKIDYSPRNTRFPTSPVIETQIAHGAERKQFGVISEIPVDSIS
jgi:hypothetical protein